MTTLLYQDQIEPYEFLHMVELYQAGLHGDLPVNTKRVAYIRTSQGMKLVSFTDIADNRGANAILQYIGRKYDPKHKCGPALERRFSSAMTRLLAFAYLVCDPIVRQRMKDDGYLWGIEDVPDTEAMSKRPHTSSHTRCSSVATRYGARSRIRA